MIDVHCHLNFRAFEKDHDDVIKRAFDAGVTKIINVGTSLESSAKAVKLAQQYENLYAIVGIHPHHADKVKDGWIKELEKIAKSKKVVAIGEIGMDYYYYKSNGIVNPEIQRIVFLEQIKLAYKLNLPLQIHNRQAAQDILLILKSNKNLLRKNPGMFHCFAATIDVLEEIVEMGFMVGFDGNITYSGIAKGETVPLNELCERTPLENLLVETDAPFLTPQPHRGSRNEPSYAIITATEIAKIKAISFEDIEKATTQNTEKLFMI